MRVLFVSQEMPPETGWGGIGTYVDVLARALAGKGVDVHVLSVVEGLPATTKEVAGVVIHRRPLPRVRGSHRLPPETWRRVWLPLTVERLIRKLRLQPSVVECPEWCAEGLAVGLRGALPLVVRMHSSARQLFRYNGQGRKWFGLDGRVAATLEEASARRAHVIVGTRSSLAEARRRLRVDERALHTISYPVPPEPLHAIPDSGSLQVTFLGRFEPRKGPEVLLRAVPQVLESVPEARFAFVGRDATVPGGPSSAAWLRREAARLGAAHAVDVREQFGRDVVDRELKQSTVCAFPSRWESFGYVVAEAAAIGRPVVVSEIPAFHELVEDGVTGYIAPVAEPEQWARALIEVLSNPTKASAMGKAAAARVAASCDPGHIADLTLLAYEHAIERWRRGAHASRL